VTLQIQWLTMALMLGSGFVLGVILDLYRVLKARFRLRGWTVSLGDLLYWTGSAGLVFGLLMWSNWGQLRFSLFLAVCVGFILYFRWMSPAVIRWIRRTLREVERLIRLIFHLFHTLVWQPLAWLTGVLKRLVRMLAGMLLSSLRTLLLPLRWMFRPVANRARSLLRPRLDRLSKWIGAWKSKWKRGK
jgi:spore cortex biosynthesis protein YabQ